MARRLNPQIRTVTQCAICQGFPSDAVKPQYAHTDPTKAPVPLGDGEEFYLYEDEKKAVEAGKPWTGMLKPFFRFLGWGKKEEPAAPKESKKAAARKKSGGLFER